MKKSLLFLLIALSLAFTACTTETPTPTPVPSRAVVASRANLVEQWRFPFSHMGRAMHYPPLFLITDGKVIIPSFFGNRSNATLLAFSLENGKAAWETSIEEMSSYVQSWFVDTEHLYLVFNEYVSAYRLSDGHQEWVTEIESTRGIYEFYPWDSGTPLLLYKSTSRQDDLILIDPLNGRIISKQPRSFDFRHDSFDFHFEQNPDSPSNSDLSAIERSSGQVLWTSSIYIQGNINIGFIGDDLIYQDGLVHYGLVRLSTETGAEMWRTPPVYISNYALAGDRIYALRQEGALAVLDAETGRETGQVAFAPPAPQEVGSNAYWVTANNEYVVVFFDDAQELIAFKVE